MASLAVKNDTYVVRFRYAGKNCKKSLRTTFKGDADGALSPVKLRFTN